MLDTLSESIEISADVAVVYTEGLPEQLIGQILTAHAAQEAVRDRFRVPE